ncbi:hypothetical protein BDQ12DRAFT_88060 [Crucibulum laeve]|uniref:Telomere-associated protein Rif1 N-terminal domain-containing protein n=1 Tax=Crucibulum laeve TaxID=68775 RepID=A0A5C3M3U1_9AGAR|nr:hypothetical protein BDQ12DRAFT_88060 [Crucibulum laeve]
MALLTPPNTSHRTEKENRFSDPSSRVVWSPHNQYHSLGSPLKPPAASASKEPPIKSILKKRDHVLLPLPEENQREETPEPSDPLVNLNYLEYPVSKIIALDASLRDLIEGYSVLAARIRSCVSGVTDADASWPLFQPLRKNSTVFVNAVVRDLGRALVDPLEGIAEEEGVAKFSLPSPKSSPKKKKRGMSAEQVKYARDLCTTTHSVLKFLSAMLSFPAVFNIFEDDQLGEVLTAILSIPIAENLPTPNARKTCALAIWLLQIQRLPLEVLVPARDRIAYALRRGLDGELGKEGKKGSACDGLKAIHDLSVYQPSTFVPAFTEILPSVLSNLLAPNLALRTQACHALGGFVIGLTSIPQSYVHARISNAVGEFLTTIPAVTKKLASPTKHTESLIVRTLRTTMNALEPEHVAQGPVWAISVLASFVVMLGPALRSNVKVGRIIGALSGMPMRHKKSSLRALCCLSWRAITWAYFQPPFKTNPDEESEEKAEGEEKAESGEKEEVCRDAYWKVVQSVVQLQAGVATIAALLDESNDEGQEEALRKTISVLQSMVVCNGQTCADAVEVMRQLVTVQIPDEKVDSEEWDMNKLITHGLFSANPGLLTAEWKSLQTAVRPIFEQVPTVDDVRPLKREEIVQDWVWDGFIELWKKALGQLKMGDDSDVPFSQEDIIGVWHGLVQANMLHYMEYDDELGMSSFAVKAADVIIDLIEDQGLDFRPTPKEADGILPPSIGDSDPPILEVQGSHTNGFLKLRIIRKLWAVIRSTFHINRLNDAGERMLACLMKYEEELVESDDSARSSWVKACIDVLAVCDVDAIRAFWGYEIVAGNKPWSWSWSAEIKAAVWKTCVSRWIDSGGEWNGAVILLGVPFTPINEWTLSNEESTCWEKFLAYTVTKALDYGVDSIAVLDTLATFISENQVPTSTSSTRIADLLMTHLEMADARDIPEAVMEFVNETMRSSYPPEPRNKEFSMWMVRALTDVLDRCPSELRLRLLESIQEGLCIWLSDEYESWTLEELSYNFLPLYQHALLCIQTLPMDVKVLNDFTPILESVFTGRSDMIAVASEAFRDFWEITSSALGVPKGGWSAKIQHCLDVAGAPDNSPTNNTTTESESSPISLLAPAVELDSIPSRPSTPTTPVTTSRMSSPPRPQKSSCGTFGLYPLPMYPESPVRARITLKSYTPATPKLATPKRTPLSVHSTEPTLSPSKRRKLEGGDKENSSPRSLANFASVVERIAMRSPEMVVKPFSLGKRLLEDADWDDETQPPIKKGKVTAEGQPTVKVLDLPTAIAVDSCSLALAPGPSYKKRKRTAFDDIVAPSSDQAHQPKLKQSVSLSLSQCALPRRPPSARLIQKRALSSSNGASDSSISATSSKRKRRQSTIIGDCIIVNPRRKSLDFVDSPKKPMEPSSDDDPHLGQVTPHHLISPALRKSRSMDDMYDPPSDDSVMSSSPSKELVNRRLQRMGSFTSQLPLKPLVL